MNLIRQNSIWEPFSLIEGLSRESFFSPAVDVHEEDKQYIVKADLPGINKDHLDVSVSDNVLTIRGERKEERQLKTKGSWHSERWYGSFSRSIELPAEADVSSIKASFSEGVLELTIPKTENARPKQIKVEVK